MWNQTPSYTILYMMYHSITHYLAYISDTMLVSMHMRRFTVNLIDNHHAVLTHTNLRFLPPKRVVKGARATRRMPRTTVASNEQIVFEEENAWGRRGVKGRRRRRLRRQKGLLGVGEHTRRKERKRVAGEGGQK